MINRFIGAILLIFGGCMLLASYEVCMEAGITLGVVIGVVLGGSAVTMASKLITEGEF